MRRRLVLGAAIVLGVTGCGSQATKTVTVLRTVTGSATVTPLPSSTAALAAEDFNAAYHTFQASLNRVSSGGGQTTETQIAAGATANAKIRTEFDAALSNINFPASAHGDVKALLIADTVVEDDLARVAYDAANLHANLSAAASDSKALIAATTRFNEDLTAVRYDVRDTA